MLATAAFFAAQTTALVDRLTTLVTGSELEGTTIAVCVLKKSGKELFQFNGTKRLVPASNEKILTSVFALDQLGENWRPKTLFWKEGESLYVSAPGDPTITTRQLLAVKAKLKLNQCAHVYLKQAFAPGYPPSWEYDDLFFTYASPIHAFSFDNASFSLSAHGGAFVALPAYLGITTSWDQKGQKSTAHLDPWTATLSLSGPPPSRDRTVGAFPIPDPSGAACRLLGGQRTPCDTVPARDPDEVIEGPTLADILLACLKPSDNTYAEHILLLAAPCQPGGDAYPEAVKQLTHFLETKVHIGKDEARPIDGSGLSRQNLVTARALAQVLRYSWNNGYRATLIRALPHPGDGTLRNRLAGIDVAAKTGTINAVTSISGYLGARGDNPLIFSILINGSTKPAAQMRGLQDKIIGELARSQPYVGF